MEGSVADTVKFQKMAIRQAGITTLTLTDTNVYTQLKYTHTHSLTHIQFTAWQQASLLNEILCQLINFLFD